MQKNIGGFTWDGSALTIPADGFYRVDAGFVAANGTTGNRGIQVTKNTTNTDVNVVLKSEISAFGNLAGVPEMFAKGDVLRLFYNTANVSGNVGNTAGDTFLKVYRIGAKA